MLHSIAARTASLSGWKRWATALAAGVGAVLALPPLHGVPVLAVVFPVLLWLLDGASRGRSAFFVGWWFGLGYFMAGLYWIANALLIDAGRFAWMIPFAVGGLSAVLAVYIGVAALIAWRLAPARSWARILVFAGAWALAEWVRAWAFTGFPWNPLGSVWMPVAALVQPAAWVGVFGLSLLTALVFAALAALGWGRGRGAWMPPAAALTLLAAVGVAGAVRLAVAPSAEAQPMVEDVRLRLVQPNIPQGEKWAPEHRINHLRRHVAMSISEDPDHPPTHVIWGETAVPFALDGADSRLPAAIAQALEPAPGREAEVAVLTGVVRRSPPGQEPYQVWNSVAAIDATGAVRAVYDKSHLVPFGEYVPFRSVLPLDKITPGATDFTPGPGLSTLALPGLPAAGALVCYEVIFPGAVVDPANRPAWLLNVTNDGWYGYSTGPFQHLATSRLRAVEEGLPMVRVANTGVSAIIDPYGRVLARIGLSQAGAVDGPLPQALPPTLFAQVGNALPVGLAALVLAAGAWGGARTVRRRQRDRIAHQGATAL